MYLTFMHTRLKIFVFCFSVFQIPFPIVEGQESGGNAGDDIEYDITCILKWEHVSAILPGSTGPRTFTGMPAIVRGSSIHQECFRDDT